MTAGQVRVERTARWVSGGIHGTPQVGPAGPDVGPPELSPAGPTAPVPRAGGPSEEELARDAALVEALALAGCEGPLWERTAERLAGFGIDVLHSLLLEGGLQRESEELGRPIRLRPDELAALRRDEVARDEVVDEAVVKGLDLFRRRTVMGGVWTPAGGARLDTYFVNGAVLALANPLRHWRLSCRDDLAEPWAPDELDRHLEDGRPARDPVDELLDREDTDAVLDWLGPVLGKAALLKIHTGWSWAKVAAALGLSAQALERRLRRFRNGHAPHDLGDSDD